MSSPDRPTLFFLHFLGGSAREWRQVIRRLEPSFRCVALDLPGFGTQAQTPGYTVADMAAQIADAIRALAPRSWGLVGHSMGAKVAAVVARAAEDGDASLAGLTGLALLAGSPPGPEPMPAEQRQTMLGWFAGDAASSATEAAGFIAQNTGIALDAAWREQAVADVLATDRAAWVAWLTAGSREDWSDRIGVLQTPTLLLAGAEDAALGPQAQARLMAPHFARVQQVDLPGAKHLLPMELPDRVAELLLAHWSGERREAAASDPAYLALIHSDRVSTRTREALLTRAAPVPAAFRPSVLTPPQLATLRALLDRVVPQSGDGWIDLGARLDRQLAAAEGDGWRHASLPADADAYRAGLTTLAAAAQARHRQPFAHLDSAQQETLLQDMAAGELAVSVPHGLDAARMKLWFEDLRADAVRLYVAHPATLARIGYSGIAYGGDGEPKPGFVELGAGAREPWEPVAKMERLP